MRPEHIRYLRCPDCRGGLGVSESHVLEDGRIEDGQLRCERCGNRYPVVKCVPRFVADQGYTAGFGLEWNRHGRTQYDRRSGTSLSESRFFTETGWPRNLTGEVIIEAGSGSGRFTEHAARTGAMVVSLDYSRAVEANFASNGHNTNVAIVQGDLFRMPFPLDFADRLFCFGVLQHTPNPRAALEKLVRHVRPGGELVADIYAKTFAKYVLGTKYWVRPLTRRLRPESLYKLTSAYIDLMWPVARRLRQIPRVGTPVNWRLLIGDYSELIADDEVLRDWAKLDTFDMLSPRYDKPARAKTVRRWCAELGLESVEVKAGYNGYEIHARRPFA